MNLFHVSNASNLTIMEPRIPSGFTGFNGEMLEDAVTKRICFSKTITGCLLACTPNIYKDTYYVYMPHRRIFERDVHRPTETEVIDKKLTKEIWVTDKTIVDMIGSIKVVDTKTIHRTSRFGWKYDATLCLWKWDYIKDNVFDKIAESQYLKQNFKAFKTNHVFA